MGAHMIALILANWRLVAKAAAVLWFCFVLFWAGSALVDHGKLVERQTAMQRAEKERTKADAAERFVLDCPPGQWVRGKGCAPGASR